MIDKIIENCYASDFYEINKWCDAMYEATGADAIFSHVNQIYSSISEDPDKISEIDLAWILLVLPMEIISVSESLNKLRAEHSVVKLRQKEIRIVIQNKYEDNPSMKERELADHKVVEIAYDSVIKKLENQISFSRELIMSAKKIWDSRRSSENVMPVSENDLPEYKAQFR